MPVSELPKEFSNFFDAPDKFVPAEGGETYEELVARAGSFIEEVVVPASKELDRMLIVAHGALNKALMLNLNDQPIKAMWAGIFQRNSCVNIYEINGHDYKLIQNGKIYYEEQEGKRYK